MRQQGYFHSFFFRPLQYATYQDSSYAFTRVLVRKQESEEEARRFFGERVKDSKNPLLDSFYEFADKNSVLSDPLREGLYLSQKNKTLHIACFGWEFGGSLDHLCWLVLGIIKKE